MSNLVLQYMRLKSSHWFNSAVSLSLFTSIAMFLLVMRYIGGFIIAVILTALYLAPAASAQSPNLVPVIIGLKKDVKPEALLKYGVKLKEVYELIPAVSALVPEDLIPVIKRDPGVRYVVRDAEVRALEIQWGVERIKAPEAWEIGGTTGDGLVEVAVIDTGINFWHSDLSQNIEWGICLLWFIRSTNPWLWNDYNGHGTHVAGIVAATLNGVGVAGVAPSVKLYAIKALNFLGMGTVSDIIEGIEWAIRGPDGVIDSDGDGVVAGDPDDDAAEVINMSLGTSEDVPALHEAIIAAKNYGVIVVAAAGNSGDGDPTTDNVTYPGRYPEVIAVAATDINDQVPTWSSDGEEVDVAAPGVDIYSTWTWNSYRSASGTSMATPHVAGVVALMQAVRLKNGKPILTFEEVYYILTSTADDILEPGWDRWSGFGIVRADKCVEEALNAP